jgi:outer membrane lipoprotein SlyB
MSQEWLAGFTIEGVQTLLGRVDGAQLGRVDGAQLGRVDGAQLGRVDGAQLGRVDGAQLGRVNVHRPRGLFYQLIRVSDQTRIGDRLCHRR